MDWAGFDSLEKMRKDDMGDMATGIAEFCLNRESVDGKAYAYEFARPLPTDHRPNVLEGAFHSSDLWYVFKSLKHCWRPWTQGDWDLSEVMLTAWINFAKYGNPYFVNNVSYDVSFISKLETPFQISEVIHIFTLRKYH